MNRELVLQVLAGRQDPTALPQLLQALWRDGFFEGHQAAQPRIARAEAERDAAYYALHNPEEAKARHREMLRAFDVAMARRSASERWAELDRIAAERIAAERREAAPNSIREPIKLAPTTKDSREVA